MQPALRRSERGLDWFTFFVADIQTGFGPFLAVYLTTQKWNQADIGLILAIGSLAGLISQLPAGWLVDMAASKRRLAMLAIVGIGLSAFLIALMPSFLGILIAKLLHVASSSVLGPAIAAITLGLVGHAAVGPRLGRNARFASIRQRSGRRRDGCNRLSDLATGGVPGHGGAGATDAPRLGANSRE